MSDKMKNLTLGVFVLGALSLLCWGLFLLHPSFGDGKQHIRVRFSEIDHIAVGTRVTFAGKPIGQVVTVELVPQPRVNDDDQIYAYELTLTVDSKVSVYPNDDITIKTAGLMGERFIAIIPKKLLHNDDKPLQNNDLISARSSSINADETFHAITRLTQKMNTSIDEVIHLEKKAHTAIEAISGMSNEIKTFFQKANDSHLIEDTQKFIALLSSKNHALGKLLHDNKLYFDGLEVLSGAKTLMRDINEYGLLFHSDKIWQRERRKKIELLAQLETPEQVKEFISTELKKMDLSLYEINCGAYKVRDKSLLIDMYDDLLHHLEELNMVIEEKKRETAKVSFTEGS